MIIDENEENQCQGQTQNDSPHFLCKLGYCIEMRNNGNDRMKNRMIITIRI